LRSFVLHAPLAKLLAEGKGWKLATALHAICHLRIEACRPITGDFRVVAPLDADYHVNSFGCVRAAFVWDIIEAAL